MYYNSMATASHKQSSNTVPPTVSTTLGQQSSWDKTGVKVHLINSDGSGDEGTYKTTSVFKNERQDSVVIGVNNFGGAQEQSKPLTPSPTTVSHESTFGFTSYLPQDGSKASQSPNIPQRQPASTVYNNFLNSNMPGNPSNGQEGFQTNAKGASTFPHSMPAQTYPGPSISYPPAQSNYQQSQAQPMPHQIPQNPFELLSGAYQGANVGTGVGGMAHALAGAFHNLAQNPHGVSGMPTEPGFQHYQGQGLPGMMAGGPQGQGGPFMPGQFPPGLAGLAAMSQVANRLFAQGPGTYPPQGPFFPQGLGGQPPGFAPPGQSPSPKVDDALLWQIFSSNSTSGMISSEKTITAIEQICSMRNAPAPDVFSSHGLIMNYDQNRDGYLSYEEFRQLIINNFFF